MDDRDRATPVTLARNAPVAQTELRALGAQPFGFQIAGDGIERRLKLETVVLAGIDAHADLGIGLVPWRCDLVVGIGRRANHHADLQPILRGKGKIALVVCGNGHHRAFAVAHQDVVGDPHRQLLAIERMDD